MSKPRPKLHPTTLMDFAKRTRKRRSGPPSPLDFRATAQADVMAFAKLKAAGETTASWNEFAGWVQQTHNITMRGASLWAWANRNRSQ